jgi:hypothetical protein
MNAVIAGAGSARNRAKKENEFSKKGKLNTGRSDIFMIWQTGEDGHGP